MKKIITIGFALFVWIDLHSQDVKLKSMDYEMYFGGYEIEQPLDQIIAVNIDNTVRFRIENKTNESYAFFLDDSYFRFFPDDQFTEEKYGFYNDYFRIQLSIEKEGKPIDFFAGTYRPDDTFTLKDQLAERDSLLFKKYAIEEFKQNKDSLMISHFLENHYFILKPGEIRYIKTDISLPEYFSDENTSAMTFFLKPREQYEVKLRYVMKKEKVLKYLPNHITEYFKKERIKIFEGELISEKIPLLYVKTGREIFEEF